MVALGLEEVRPRFDFGMLLEESAPLPFGHAAPHAEFDAVVERIRAALHQDGAMATDRRGFPLRCTTNEQLVGIYFSTSGL